MKTAESELAPDNPLTERIRKWKKDQGMVSLTLDELKEKIKDKKYIVEQKVDGQSAIMEYKDGKARFGSLGGRILTDLPVLTEIEALLKTQGVTQTVMVGELAGVENGKIIHFDKTESLIKNPSKDKEALHWFPYQVLELEGEKYGEGLDIYLKTWPNIARIFKGSKHIQPVKSASGDIDAFWAKIVLKEENEGVVVRTEGKVYKAKPTFTYDLVIVAVGSKKGLNWPKKKISNTLMAFMDEYGVFRTAGNIGTGWSDAESRELYSWAQKNKVGEDDELVWVKPERIVELQWERSSIKDYPAYRFEKGKYVPVGDKPVGTIVKPRFLRYRTDKKVNPNDLRLTQIPNWVKTKKMARRIASRHVQAVIRKCRPSDKDDRPANEQIWCLFTHDGSRLLGRHHSKEKAQKQENAIHYFKGRDNA